MLDKICCSNVLTRAHRQSRSRVLRRRGPSTLLARPPQIPCWPCPHCPTHLVIILLADPLELPLDDDLCEVDSKLALLDGGVVGEAQPLDGGYHVLDQVLPDRVVDTVVTAQQLPAGGGGGGGEVGARE